MDMLFTGLLELWIPVLAPPPVTAGCTVRTEIVGKAGDLQVARELHYDPQGRVDSILLDGDIVRGKPETTQIVRDATGCITEVRQSRSGDTARMSCGPDGSPAGREDRRVHERWAPPTRSGAGWTQLGSRDAGDTVVPLRQTWTPLGEHGVRLKIKQDGKTELDLRLELGTPGPAGPRPALDYMPLWSSGVTRVVTDAQGRLVAREGKAWGEPWKVRVRWSEDGRSGELDLDDEPTAAVRCEPGRCEVPAHDLTEVWSCPVI
jgi:hypothetical protein